jgi:hypothetical protein
MLKLLLAPQFIGLYVLAVSTVYVHFRGRERLRLGRQLGDHSTYLAPYNVLMYAGSAVPNRPVIPLEEFPELAKLNENWQTIRDEAVRLFDEGFIRAAAKNNDWGFYSFFKSGWKRFYLKWYDDFLPSARAMPADGGAVELDSVRSWRDVCDAAVGRQVRGTSRSLCGLAALSPRLGDAQLGQMPDPGRRRAVRLARRRGLHVRRDLHPQRGERDRDQPHHPVL